MWDYSIFWISGLNKILTIILLSGFVIEMFYLVFFYMKFAFARINEPDNVPSVSVIIAAQNQAHNLEKFLPLILKQDYPNYEVIVVNHASADETELLLKRLGKEYKHLVVRNIPKTDASNHSKKLALTVGIRAAKNDVLLFTDADCYPASDQWIKKMVRHFDQQTKIVLGYGAYEAQKGLLDKHIRTETAMIAMQYFGFAMRGLPYMGVGRNIAWRKSFFEEKGGFQSHIFEPSGSDDIFVNQNGTKHNTRVEFSPQSFTYSVPPRTWKDYVLQKQRHFGSSKFYKLKYKILLGLEPLFRIIFLISVIGISIFLGNLYPVILWGIREITLMATLIAGLRKLREKKIFLYSLIYDIYQPVLHLFIFSGRKKRINGKW